MNDDPKISVIICVYTEKRLLDIKEAVQSVIGQSISPYEIVVSVDHNDKLFDILRNELPTNIKIVKSEGIKGLSEARNVGIRFSSGDIVAFIDDDAVADRNWLLNLTLPFKNNEVMAVGGKAIPLWPNDKRPDWFPEELDWVVGCTYKGLPIQVTPDGLTLIRNVPGCNMAFLKDVFYRVGFWNPQIGSIGQSLKGGEEAEICLRIKNLLPNSLIALQSSALISHKVPSNRATLKWLWKDSYDQGRCKAKLVKLAKFQNVKTLSAENSYIRFLIIKSFPSRLRYFFKRDKLRQSGAILTCIVGTGLGYFTGKLG